MYGVSASCLLLLVVAGMAAPLAAQSPGPAFEVASVKRAEPGKTGGRVRFLPGGRFVGENVSLEFVIQQVYGLRDFQLIAAPPLKAIIKDGYGARYGWGDRVGGPRLDARNGYEDRVSG